MNCWLLSCNKHINWASLTITACQPSSTHFHRRQSREVPGVRSHKNLVVGVFFGWDPQKFHWNKFNISKIDISSGFVSLQNVTPGITPGVCPGPLWGSLQRSPRSSSWWGREHPLLKKSTPLRPMSFAVRPSRSRHFHGPHNVVDGLATMLILHLNLKVICSEGFYKDDGLNGVLVGCS